MSKLIAFFFGRLPGIDIAILCLFALVSAAVAGFDYFQHQRLLDVTRQATQLTLPGLLDAERMAKDLDQLHYNGNVLAFSPTGAFSQRAWMDAQALMNQPSLQAHPLTSPLVTEAETLLTQLAGRQGARGVLVQRWEKLANRLTDCREQLMASAIEQAKGETERAETMVNQSYLRFQVMLGTIALLILFALVLRRRHATTAASLDESESVRQRLEDENLLLRLMADNTADGMIFIHSFVAQEGFPLIYGNAAFARHLGYAPEDLSGLALADYTDLSADGLTALMVARSYSVETEFLTRDGRRIPVEMSLSRFEHHGQHLLAGYGRDISERQAAAARLRALEVEAALRQRDRCYKELFDAFADAVFLVDIADDGRFIHWALNPRAEAIVGHPGGSAVGYSVEELFAADVASVHTAQYRDCVDSGAQVEYGAEIARADGSLARFEITLLPLSDGGRRVRRIAGIFRDVSERVAMENRVRDAAAQLRAFLDNIPDPAWIKGPDNRYLAVNPAFVRQVGGGSAERIVSRLDLDFLPGKVARANLSHDTQVMLSGESLRTEECVSEKGGQRRHYEVIRSPLRDGAGAIVGTVGIARDVTRRVHAQTLLEARERAFRSLAENIPDNIGRYTRDARFTYASPQLARALKRSPEELIGRTPGEICPRGTLDDYQAQILSVAETGRDGCLEMTVPQTDGTLQYRRIRFVAERDGSGRTIGVLSIGTDVTEQIETERTIRNMSADWAATLQALPDLLFEMDLDGRYRGIWAHRGELLAGPHDFPIGKTVQETMPAPVAEVLMAALHEAHATGSSYGKVIALARGDGLRWFELSVAQKAGDVGNPRFVILSRDITERERVKLEFQRYE